jgi:formylglycine-generating enzyme required for sulfatase activity
MKIKSIAFILTTSLALPCGLALAGVPETVVIGNPGNSADSTGYGAVAYAYKIGKFEVTNREYCEFLNAAAKTDTYELYDGRMGEGGDGGRWGGITRRGVAGRFAYSVIDGRGEQPVGYVTWESCARFCNWLSNGSGKGDTEKGVYTIKNGKVKVTDHAALAAGKETKWVIASENEWYKAAYYDPTKSGSGYWTYATKGGSAPKANINSNNPTSAGSFAAASAYGTFDQNGNVWEYNETQANGKVGVRGGSFYINDIDSYLQSGTRYDDHSAKEPNYGFRVVALGGTVTK